MFLSWFLKSKPRGCCCSVRPSGNAALGVAPVPQGHVAYSETSLQRVGMAQPEKAQAAATCCGQEWPICPSQPAWPVSCEGCLQYHQKSRPETQSASAQRTLCPCRAARVVALAQRIDRESAIACRQLLLLLQCLVVIVGCCPSIISPAAACLHRRGLLQLQGGAWIPAGACLGTGLICFHCRGALSCIARAREGRRSWWICSKTGLLQAT